MSLFVITGRRVFLDFFQYLVYINLVPKFVKGGVNVANYFCAKISQEHSEGIRILALNLGVPPEKIVFSKVGCDFCSLGVYIKFEDQKVFEKFRKDLAPFIIEEW